MLDACNPEPRRDIPDEAQPPDGQRSAFLYAATSRTLRQWSSDLGMEVRHLGIAADPLRRVRDLARNGYADLSYFIEPFEPADARSECWNLAPLLLDARMAMPAGCEPWGGAVRITIPPGLTIAHLQHRFSLLMAPLEATSCAQLPSAVEARYANRQFLPIMPRYSLSGSEHVLVTDLYRWSDGDQEYAVEALDATLRSLGPEQHADAIFATLSRAPGSAERARADGAVAR